MVSARLGSETFDLVLMAGADMYLAKPVRFEQILLAVRAVVRRSGQGARALQPWRLSRKAASLTTPPGVVVRLRDTDLAVLGCFAEADGSTVARATLCQRLGREPSAASDNWLHATILRLRRRLEQSTEELVPLQSQPRVGCVFRGKLTAV